MISNSFFAFALYFVSYLTCINKIFHSLFNYLCTFCNFFNYLQVTCTKLLGFFGREYLSHILNVLCQLTLIVSSNRNDVVHRQVAHNTCLYLYTFCISIPFNFVTGIKFLLRHHIKRLEHLYRFFA